MCQYKIACCVPYSFEFVLSSRKFSQPLIVTLIWWKLRTLYSWPMYKTRPVFCGYFWISKVDLYTGKYGKVSCPVITEEATSEIFFKDQVKFALTGILWVFARSNETNIKRWRIYILGALKVGISVPNTICTHLHPPLEGHINCVLNRQRNILVN